MEKEQKIVTAKDESHFEWVNRQLKDGWRVKFCVAQAVSTSSLMELSGNIVFVLERDKPATSNQQQATA